MKEMQLCYRRLHYKYNVVSWPIIESGITGKYRGITYKIKQPLEVNSKPVFELKYRGVTYKNSAGLRVHETNN
ncbi:MAG: DUF4278 domain-containing protein [Xenococcaceae cyanobacterium]